MVEFKGKFDENVTANLNKHIFKKNLWLFLLCSLLFIGIGVAAILLREDDEDLGYGITLITFGVIFPPLVILVTKILQKIVNKSMPILSSDTIETYQFYPDRMIITQVKQRYGEEESEYEATTNTRYSYLYRVEETQDHYFLRISKMQSHIISKSNLTEGTLEELNGILSSALGTKFKPMKK